SSLLNLPSSSTLVADADEEIFLLYTSLNQAGISPDGYRGLGHVDSRKDSLTIQFELTPLPLTLSQPPGSTVRSKKGKQHSRRSNLDSRKLIEIEVAQDKTALWSRKGDTGSVVWRASIEFAKAILQQHFFPTVDPLFDRDKMAQCNCVELGSGTGLLGIALAPLVRSYVASDIAALVPLIRKNMSLNFSGRHHGSPSSSERHQNITAEELDWTALASLPPGNARVHYCPAPVTGCGWDLVLVVDCIYHPSLLPALVETIDTVSTPGRTWVVVVAELRQEDVLREFLELWLKHNGGAWQITRIEGLLDRHYGVWAGQKA
ncbi:putative methyltransferase-domain-containing protein, partial [Phlebopus sp. FC_14]